MAACILFYEVVHFRHDLNDPGDSLFIQFADGTSIFGMTVILIGSGGLGAYNFLQQRRSNVPGLLSADNWPFLDKLDNSRTGDVHIMAVAQAGRAGPRASAEAERLVEAERRRIARDLHDTLGQDLAYLRLKLDQLASLTADLNTPGVHKDLSQMLDVANGAYNKVRQAIVMIEPVKTADLGNAIQDLAQAVGNRAGLRVVFSSQNSPTRLPEDIQRQAICIVREALNNIEKHARASQVTLSLNWRFDSLVIKIGDNGCGFQADQIPVKNHFGLAIMRERAESIHGQVTLASSDGNGAEVTLTLPLLADIGQVKLPTQSFIN